MRLTWRDALGTLVTGAGVLAGLAALQGWGWPFLADARAGVIALLAISLVVCPLGFANPSPTFYRDPFVVLAMVIGTGILVLGVIALFTSPAAYLPFVIGLTAANWAVTTIHHAVGPQELGRAVAA